MLRNISKSFVLKGTTKRICIRKTNEYWKCVNHSSIEKFSISNYRFITSPLLTIVKEIRRLYLVKARRKFPKESLIWFSGFFGLFQEKEDDPESELITTIKRAVLMIQREEYKPAEQILHIALKLAQDTGNDEGITYIYDVMANLAFTQGEFVKAEALFKSVMQRMLQSGISQDDLKVSHISLKLAKIYEVKKNYAMAEDGYRFCLANLQKKVDVSTDDEDTVMLWAMSLDWYARFLLDRNRLDESFEKFQKAYDICLKIHGEIHEQTVVLLNDLGTISFLKGDSDQALEYLTKAIEIGKHLPNMEDFSSVYVNLGNIYMRKQLYEEAKKFCREGWRNATRHKNNEGVQEASMCLKELDKYLKA